MDRREFLKKSTAGVIGVCAGSWALNLLGKEGESLSKLDAVPFKESKIELWKWSKEALYYSELTNNEVRCKLCPHRCLLKPNYRGACRTRVNKDGKLYTKTYGNPCAVNIDPIEKKPFYHFLPETKAFSIATAGCNLRCHYCQNWEISQSKPEITQNIDLMPNSLIEAVLKVQTTDSSVKSIAYTYAEPTTFYEYMIDSADLGREKGLRNVVISAGYMEKKPLKTLCKKVDAIKIDLKGFDEKFYRNICSAELEYVQDACVVVADEAVHFEIVNLVVPTLNDDIKQIRRMCRWIVDELNTDIPVHFSRFSPAYKLKNLPPTPMETLIAAYETAKDAGLKYVYIGNVPHGDWENTYCANCKKLVIERQGYTIIQNKVGSDGKCSKCGKVIPGVWS